jgi:hypothetical protein
METDAHSRALLNISFGVRSKRSLPLGPHHGIIQVTEILIPTTQGFMAYIYITAISVRLRAGVGTVMSQICNLCNMK